MRRLLCVALASVMIGCGSTNDVSLQSGGSVAQAGAATTLLAGKVVDERGGAVAGVSVVVHERTTNLKAEGVSGADGSFSLAVPSGVYDLGLDKNGDPLTASCFYGPIDTATAQSQNFVLRDSNGRPVNQVFGKIWLQPGVAATNRQVTLRPSIELVDNDMEVPPPVSTNTANDGSFNLQVASNREVGLDVEVHDAGGVLDEFIDVGKRDKPCYAEFITEQSPVENRLRANQSELPVPTGPSKTAGAVTGVAVAFIQFTAVLPVQGGLAILRDGQLPVDGITRLLKDIVSGGTPNDSDNSKLWGVLEFGYIRLAANGAWWYKYAVNVYTDRETRWSFTDFTNDSYSLWIINTNGDPTGAGMHKVSYNSSNPILKRIQYKL